MYNCNEEEKIITCTNHYFFPVTYNIGNIFYDIMINIFIVWTISSFSLGVSSLNLKTEDVIFEEGDTIILNCTYVKDGHEVILDRNIRWQTQIRGSFKDIALFSPPGGPEPFISKAMQSLYSNRTELISPNILLSAVMIINPICSDQGVYQCRIEYFSKSSEKVQTSGSVVKFKCNYFSIIITIQFW